VNFKERWRQSLEEENAILRTPPQGVVNGRKDFRGFSWKETSPTTSFLRCKEIVQNVDLSYSEIDGWCSTRISLENFYLHSAHLPNIRLLDSTIKNCQFIACDVTGQGSAIFAKSHLIDTVFDACRGNDTWLTLVASAHGSRFIELDIRDVGDRDPVKAPLITECFFSGTLQDWFLPQGRGAQQFYKCDISQAELKNVSFPGVNFDHVTYSERISPFVIADWEQHEPRLRDAVSKAITEGDREASLAGRAISRILKKESEAAYWIKNRWDRGSRFAFELHLENDFPRETVVAIANVYRSIGLIPDSHPSLTLSR